MPCSFKGAHGKIAYTLKAVLSRSMRIDKKDSSKINFIAKENPSTTSLLMVCVCFNGNVRGLFLLVYYFKDFLFQFIVLFVF